MTQRGHYGDGDGDCAGSGRNGGGASAGAGDGFEGDGDGDGYSDGTGPWIQCVCRSIVSCNADWNITVDI